MDYRKLTLSSLYRYKVYSAQIPQQENIMRKHFGSAPPSIHEVGKNMSLLMVGTDWLFSYPAPLPPAVITFHSLHVKTKTDPLPEVNIFFFNLKSNYKPIAFQQSMQTTTAFRFKY